MDAKRYFLALILSKWFHHLLTLYGEYFMYHPKKNTFAKKTVHDLATTLLRGLCIHHPTLEQYQAAEAFIRMVILPIEKDLIAQVGLTPKEWLCLNLAANGFSTEETAQKLAVARGTVKNHREHIIEKLQCKNIVQAVYKAFLQNEPEEENISSNHTTL